MTDELKPCPFCGSEDVQEAGPLGFSQSWVVFCLDCAIEGPKREAQADAIAAWNRRAGE